MPKIIIGCGTGRCGTVSLSVLLNSQSGFRVGHESVRMPWDFNKNYAAMALSFFLNSDKIVGDIASWYLPYMKYFLTKEDRVKVICLKRSKEEVVKSFIRKTGWKDANHWTEKTSSYYQSSFKEQAFDMHFPKYDLPLKKALEKYWNDYYEWAERLQQRFEGRFKIFDCSLVLNSENHQKQLFDFLEVENPNILLGIKANQHDSLKLRFKIWKIQNVNQI